MLFIRSSTLVEERTGVVPLVRGALKEVVVRRTGDGAADGEGGWTTALRCGGHLDVIVSTFLEVRMEGEVGDVGDAGATSTVARRRGGEGSVGCIWNGLGRCIRFADMAGGESISTVTPVLFGDNGVAMMGEGIVRRLRYVGVERVSGTAGGVEDRYTGELGRSDFIEAVEEPVFSEDFPVLISCISSGTPVSRDRCSHWPLTDSIL